MTSKGFLHRAYEIDRRLRCKYRRLKVLEDRASGSYYAQNDSFHPLYVQSRMEENAVKVMELKELIEDDEVLLKKVRSEIKETIRAIGNETYATVLEMRYLQYLTWDEIVDQTGYGRSNVFRLHGEALQCLVIPAGV